MVANANKSSFGNFKIVIILMSFIALMVMFTDIMLVPALPDIYKQFPEYAEWTSWILAIYLLSGAIANPIIGKLGDIYGKKKLLMVTLTIYTIGLIGCAIFYKSFEGLLIFRAIQGIGLATFPLFYGIIRDTFPKDIIPMAIGVVSAMFSVGVSIGLLGGGYIASEFGWEYCYYIIAPLFLLIIPIVYFKVKDGEIGEEKRKVDVVGAAILSSSMLTLLVGLTLMQGHIITSGTVITLTVLACLVYFVISIIVFFFWERRSLEPILKLSLLRGLSSTAHVSAFMYGIAMFMLSQTLPSLLMGPEGSGGFNIDSAFHVGLVMFPIAIMGMIFGPLGGKLCKKPGSAFTILAIGMGLFAVSFLFLIAFNTELWMIIVGVSIVGAGTALTMVSMMNVLMETTPKKDFGSASGMNTTIRLIGGSIGPVLGMTVLSSYIYANGPPIIYGIEGFIWTWAIGFVFCVIGFIYPLIIKKKLYSSQTQIE